MGMAERLLVTGAGGLMGHHLVARGYWVRGVDIRHPEFEPSPAHEFEIVDLRRSEACLAVTRAVARTPRESALSQRIITTA
jgi:GDP-D-mannose 3', 5'-epimerase